MTVDTQTSSQLLKKQDFGQLLMCGFDGLEPTPGIIDLIEKHNLGSIILFSRNIDTPEQVRQLTTSLQSIARRAGHKRPLFIAVDQENGVVRRLGSKSGTYLPGSMALGALGSPTAAREVAISVSKELLSFGINWNLAPVLDVNNNPLNPVIGVRSFGEDPAQVGKLGMAQVEGYHRGGVATSTKHFPGHGDTATDSHIGVPVINKTLEELERVELAPYRQIIDTGVDTLTYPSSIMVGHIVLPQITGSQVASISSAVATGLLRQRMGYKGVIITDCLEMEAVKDTIGTPQGALQALCAGFDMAMISHTLDFQRTAIDIIHTAYDKNELDLEVMTASFKRVEKLKDQFLTWDKVLDNMPPPAKPALELSERLYNKVPTIVRDNKNIIPIKPAMPDNRILFLAAHVPQTLAIDSEIEPFNSFHESLKKRHENLEYIIYTPDTKHNDLVDTIQKADYVIIGTANANLHPFQADLVKFAHKKAKRLVVAAVVNPYDLMAFSEIDTYVVAYEYTPTAHEATVRAIFGETTPTSHLPVTIPDVSIKRKDPVCIIEKYNPEIHLDEVTCMWNQVFKDWPLAADKIEKALRTAKNGNHWIGADCQTGKIIGFVATQINCAGKRCELMLLMVHPEYQSRGIGSFLHDHALDHLRRQPFNTYMLGSTYPRFFPGLPQDKEHHQGFFERLGWKFQPKHVWDLVGNLDQPNANDQRVQDRMRRENVWFGRIKPSQLWELYAFLQRYFPYWLNTYQHHADLGDFQDFLIARQDNENGKLLASLIVNTTHTSHPDRGDMIWTDDRLFTEASGGMACVGVAEEERGRGIGIGIVVKASQILKQRGVKKAYVDWVELLDFYQRAGYEPWRGYRLASL